MSGEATPADASGLKLDTEQVPADPSRQGVDCPFRQFGCLQEKLSAGEMSGHLQQEMRLHNELLIAMVANMNRDVERLKLSERSTRMRDISSRVSERSTGVSEKRIWDMEGRWIGDDSEWRSVLMILGDRVDKFMEDIRRLKCGDARKEEVEMLQRSVGEIRHQILEMKPLSKDVSRGAYEMMTENIDDAMMCVDRLREGRPCAHWIRMLERNVRNTKYQINKNYSRLTRAVMIGRWIGDDESEMCPVWMILEERVRTCIAEVERLKCDDARKDEVEMLQSSVEKIRHQIRVIKYTSKDISWGLYGMVRENIEDAMMFVDSLKEGRPCAHWINMLRQNVKVIHQIHAFNLSGADKSGVEERLKLSLKRTGMSERRIWGMEGGGWLDDDSEWRSAWTVLEGRVRTCMEEIERLKCDDARKEEVQMLKWSVEKIMHQIWEMKPLSKDVSRGAYEVVRENIKDAMKCVDSLREGRPCAYWIRMLQRNVREAMHRAHFQSGLKSGADKSSAAQESGYRELLPESDEMSKLMGHVDRIECDNKAIKLQIESMQLDIDRMKPAVQPAEVPPPVEPSRVDASLDEWVIDIGLGDTTDWAGGESGRFSGGGGGGEAPCYSHVLQAANSAGVEGASLRVHLLVVAGPHDSRLDWPFCGAVTVTVANRDGFDEASSDGGGGSSSLTGLCRIERPPDGRYRCRHAAPFEFPHAALRAAGLLLERGVRLSCRIAPDEDQ